MLVPERFHEIWRYLVAGLINTIFGFSIYALMIRLGLDRYVAQAISYVAGTVFNYITYSRHVFRDAKAAKVRFALSYAGNYLINLVALKAVSHLLPNPYLAGALTTLAIVALNYLVLKRLVFREAAA